MKLCGIDEAGRGPVIGPLVIAGVLINEDDEPKLKAMGAKDSKLLTPKQRDKLEAEIKKFVIDYKIIVISPQEIDDALGKDNGTNLNWLEADNSIKIINSLKPDRVVMDCPSPNIKAYTEYINERLKHKAALLCAHHADLNYPSVSAASIIAKTERDRLIAKLEKEIGQPIGSGYGHDPATIEFMKNNFKKHPEIFRKQWASYKNLENERKQKKLGEY